MGTDKRFLNYGGEAWLDRAIGILKATLQTDQVVFVSGETEGYNCIPDLVKDQGPLMGFYSVQVTLNHFTDSKSWFLVLPVDMPKMSSMLLQKLLPAVEDCEKHYEVIAFENQEMPLVISNQKSLRDKVKQIVQGEKSLRSFRRLLELCKVKRVAPLDLEFFANFNSPPDLEALHEPKS
jgi:molybdopterin-guanine dinucleotide biosynthesis protein A